MTDHDTHEHELTADPADDLMGKLVDARDALMELEHAAFSVACAGCDPDGERTRQVRRDLRDRYDVDFVDADALLSYAADARFAMLVVTGTGGRDCEDHDD